MSELSAPFRRAIKALVAVCDAHSIDICAFPDLYDGLTIGSTGYDFAYTPGQDHVRIGTLSGEHQILLADL